MPEVIPGPTSGTPGCETTFWNVVRGKVLLLGTAAPHDHIAENQFRFQKMERLHRAPRPGLAIGATRVRAEHRRRRVTYGVA
ncbi:hypothetical protein [Actinoplanes regularis]|uniref:hypothetical protein n=1 Tax=Actinoplanes regularis TaxID=52697 RepID=UPI002553E062|nr:hypothetical protein [Actinoplanes regularis]